MAAEKVASGDRTSSHRVLRRGKEAVKRMGLTSDIRPRSPNPSTWTPPAPTRASRLDGNLTPGSSSRPKSGLVQEQLQHQYRRDQDGGRQSSPNRSSDLCCDRHAELQGLVKRLGDQVDELAAAIANGNANPNTRDLDKAT
ncbi:MAG: hypothetical protein M1825_000381 [Sarcosagium campestre]|nr:MAG: hypothetical protein M1825_000381 [Sarcosagium campestre]